MENLQMLLKVLNSTITTLNEEGYNIFDKENETFFINSIEYDRELDKLIFNCQEDETNEDI